MAFCCKHLLDDYVKDSPDMERDWKNSFLFHCKSWVSWVWFGTCKDLVEDDNFGAELAAVSSERRSRNRYLKLMILTLIYSFPLHYPVGNQHSWIQ